MVETLIFETKKILYGKLKSRTHRIGVWMVGGREARGVGEVVDGGLGREAGGDQVSSFKFRIEVWNFKFQVSSFQVSKFGIPSPKLQVSSLKFSSF